MHGLTLVRQGDPVKPGSVHFDVPGGDTPAAIAPADGPGGVPDIAGLAYGAVGSAPEHRDVRQPEIAVEIRSVDQFLPYYEGVRERTRRVVACIPDEHMEWRHAPGRFSFGDLVRHMAALERHMFAENVAGRPSSYAGHGPELADGPDAVRRFFEEMHAESMDIFRALSEEDLGRRCTTPAGISLPVWKWLRAMVEHEVHHRGQLYLMLGMIDVPTPPVFGLTSEEVRERSVSAPAGGARA